MLSKKLLQFTIAMLLLPALTFAQNTTGSISGSVKADNGEVLVGATISVLHIPTGTVYNAQTRKTGFFDVSNVQPGGPYAVTISYVNYQSEKREDDKKKLTDSKINQNKIGDREEDQSVISDTTFQVIS